MNNQQEVYDPIFVRDLERRHDSGLAKLEQPDAYVAKSLVLQNILRAAGYRKGSGVSTQGIRLVSAVAKREGLRDWPDTQTLDDYDALIAAVFVELREQRRADRSHSLDAEAREKGQS